MIRRGVSSTDWLPPTASARQPAAEVDQTRDGAGRPGSRMPAGAPREADRSVNESRSATLTVGIPTFNRANLLAATIESVLSQSFTGFRLIVSDNASDDDTADVVRSFGDERIEFVRSERNVGSIGNLNRLIALAKTEFLVLLPDDDVLYPDHLRMAMALLETSPTVGLTHTAFNVIDAQSRIVRRVYPVASRSAMKIERHDQALDRLMVSRWPICFASVVYRTRAVVDAGGLKEEEGAFGDLQLWMRMALRWDFGYIAEPLAGFRLHAGAISTDVGARPGAASDASDLVRRHAQARFERRINFVENAPLAPGAAHRLSALAELQLLVDTAYVGVPTREVLMRLASLVGRYPRIASRHRLWRLVAAQLGGRRVRAAVWPTAAGHGRDRRS